MLIVILGRMAGSRGVGSATHNIAKIMQPVSESMVNNGAKITKRVSESVPNNGAKVIKSVSER